MKVYKIVELPLNLFYVILAVLLYKSTASFPESSQATTAIYIKVISLSFGFLGVIQLIRTFFAENQSLSNLVADPKRFFSLIGLLIIYVWLMGIVGFNVTTVVFLIVTMFVMGYKKIVNAVIISLGITFFVYFLFYKVFEIPLPEGLLF